MPEKSKKSLYFKISGILALSATLAGCASLPADAPLESVDYRACLVTDGDPTRPGLADSAVHAVNEAVVTFGVKKTIVASNPSKFVAATAQLIDSGCNFIGVVGSRFTEQMAGLATPNPEVNFLFITEGSATELLKADLPNLAVYRVDLYEAGLLAGHLAASISENRQIAVVCGSAVNAEYFRGIRSGVATFDEQSDTVTAVNVNNMAVSMSDVLLPYGCRDELHGNVATYRLGFKLVGFGRDLYTDKALVELQPQVAATIVPRAGERLLEAVAADLESEFIGGILGSTTATYGNLGLVVSDEHSVPITTEQRERLKQLATDYELTFK